MACADSSRFLVPRTEFPLGAVTSEELLESAWEALSGGTTPCLLDPILVPLGMDKYWSKQEAEKALALASIPLRCE